MSPVRSLCAVLTSGEVGFIVRGISRHRAALPNDDGHREGRCACSTAVEACETTPGSVTRGDDSQDSTQSQSHRKELLQ